MQQPHSYGRFTLFLLSLGFCFILSAQTGTLKGTVIDADGGSRLPGASIYLLNSPSKGTVTEVDGTYTLSAIPAGEQIIVFSYIGFGTEERRVVIPENDIITLDVRLGGELNLLDEEIIVTAQALGQAKAINQQLNSDAIANFVSADKIKELPDVNAAEAISRLPGVAINRSGGEGSKVVIRGLDPKFTAISINGVRLPSTSGVDRSVDLSLISPELLSGIELFKSPTPDMDGDALGGSINLNIIKAGADPALSVKVIGGYNDYVSEFKDYKATVSLTRRIFNKKLGVIATGNVERFNRSGQTLGTSWMDDRDVIIDTTLNIFDQEGASLTYQSRREIRRRYNASLGLDYSLGKNTDLTVLNIYSRTSRDQFNHSEQYDVNNNRLTMRPELRESAINLYSTSLSTNHRLNFITVNWGASFSRIVGETPFNFEMDFRDNSGPFTSEVQDVLQQPTRFINFVNSDFSKTYLQSANWIESGNNENITTAFVNFTLPINVADNIKADLKFGGKLQSNVKGRDYFRTRDFNYYLRRNTYFDRLNDEGTPALGIDPTGTFYYSVANFLNEREIAFDQTGGRTTSLLYSFSEDRLRGFQANYAQDFRHDKFGDVNNYELEENLSAVYAMLKVKVGDQLTMIPGFRYEHSDNTYSSVYADLNGDFGESGALRDTSASIEYGIFLPHFHLKYKPVEWFDVRASYSTTLARPDFNYVVPATLVNRNSDLTIRQGNPNLRPSVSTNYDLYATAFSGRYGLLSIGAFYKDIQDAFYPLILGLNNDSLAVAFGFPEVGFTGGELTTYSNTADSEVYGLEIDIQSNLNFLPAPFNGLVFNLNYARLFSSTQINSFFEETTFRRVGPRLIREVAIIPYQREVDLIGQAEHILNTSLGYDINGFSARISASYQGSKLTGYSSSADKDRFDQGFWRMDLALKQRFGSNFNIFLNVNNLTNQQDITFFRNENLITSRTWYGTTATIGAEYKFRK